MDSTGHGGEKMADSQRKLIRLRRAVAAKKSEAAALEVHEMAAL